MEAAGSTPLFDAVHLAVNEMCHASYPRKALLIVSDGIDNHSRYTEDVFAAVEGCRGGIG
jgi:Ca-activated chloride channel family protein